MNTDFAPTQPGREIEAPMPLPHEAWWVKPLIACSAALNRLGVPHQCLAWVGDLVVHGISMREPQGRRWHLKLISPREAEAQVAAAFSAADTSDAPFIERLEPSPAAAALQAQALGELRRDDPVTCALTSDEHRLLRQLADDLLHPEGFAHTVGPEVRNRARAALGLTYRESETSDAR